MAPIDTIGQCTCTVTILTEFAHHFVSPHHPYTSAHLRHVVTAHMIKCTLLFTVTVVATVTRLYCL